VIISNDNGNEHADRVIVAPITSRNLERIYPFEVLIMAGEGSLSGKRKVLLDQIRTVDKRRLGDRIGPLPDQRILEVDQAIRLSLAV